MRSPLRHAFEADDGGNMTPTQPCQGGILRQALELPDEQKARLLEEMLQHELGSSAESNRPFLEKLDEALTRLESRIQSGSTTPESAVTGRNSGSRRRPDPAPAMEWLRLHSKEYGGEWGALDGDRLISHGPDGMEGYAAAGAGGGFLAVVKKIRPSDAIAFRVLIFYARPFFRCHSHLCFHRWDRNSIGDLFRR